jgi:hypothetical protein
VRSSASSLELGSAPAAATAIWPRLNARYQQEIDNLYRVIGTSDTDRTAGWRLPYELRMFHGQRTTIRQVDVEGPERLLPKELS